MRWVLYRLTCGHLAPGKMTASPSREYGTPLYCANCRKEKKIYSFEKVIEHEVPVY